jgi:DNA topoisomerase IB
MLQHRAVEAGPNGKIFPELLILRCGDMLVSLPMDKAKPKDFRTLVGTSTAMKIMQTMNAPTNEKEYKKATYGGCQTSFTKAREHGTIALNSYISPQVFDGWKIKA